MAAFSNGRIELEALHQGPNDRVKLEIIECMKIQSSNQKIVLLVRLYLYC